MDSLLNFGCLVVCLVGNGFFTSRKRFKKKLFDGSKTTIKAVLGMLARGTEARKYGHMS